MANLLRDSTLGGIIRTLSGGRYLKYPEELPNFEFRPEAFLKQANSEKSNLQEDSERGEFEGNQGIPSSDVSTLDDGIAVSWYGAEDPENPLNWSAARKSWVTFLISLYAFVVYCGSSIIVPSYEYMMLRYGVSEEVVSLTLSIFVVGYAVGPMGLSPLSEIPMIGRNPPYFYSFVLFVIVSIILPLVDNFTAIVVLRFLQGFFGSPCLASGGASIQDIFSWSTAPYGFIYWVGGFYCGPAIGPVIAGYAVGADWRWPLWEILIMAVPFLLILLALLPETSHSTIILRRAQRLRRVTGNPNIYAPSEKRELHLSFKGILIDALIKPTEIVLKDPAMAYICTYTGLVYAIYYSFFEAFPIAYSEVYSMSQETICLLFICIIIGCVIAATMYAGYLKYRWYPYYQKHTPTPEARLIPAIPASIILTIGLLLFAWTARSSINWVVPTIGVTLYSGASFVVFQCVICYVPLSYPSYVASLFAANDFTRAMAAASFVMFTRYMFTNLGIGKGVTVLAGLSVLGILGMMFLYRYGANLRARSTFASA